MRNARLGVGIASVAAATLVVPALVSPSSAVPSRVNATTNSALSAAVSRVPAASAIAVRPKCPYPPHRAVLSIGAGKMTYRQRTSVAFGGRLYSGICGVSGVKISLYEDGKVVKATTTRSTGRWGITVLVQKTSRYYARSSSPRAQSGIVTIIIGHHH